MVEEHRTTTQYMSPMQGYGSSIVALTDPESQLYQMELLLRGQALDDSGNIREVGKALLNEEGINNVLAITRSIVNQVAVMSYFEKDEVSNKMDYLADVLAVDLMQNRYTYGFYDYSSRNRVYFIVMNYGHAAIKRAYEEGERRFLRAAQQEVRTEVMGQQNKSAISKMNPFNWGK